MNEEVCPCPVCGEPPYSENVGEKHFIKTPTPNDIRYWCRIHRDAIFFRQSWNDAYCWKEIDRLKAALQAKDAEIAELKAKNERLETQLACAADFANTWARESGVMECDNPYFGLFLRDLISRLWSKLSSLYIAELGRSEKLVELGKAVMDAIEQNGESIVKHLLDTDDNPGQRFRDLLAAHQKPEEAWK